ncbi:MAG: hypothetical protein K0S82_1903, partial [Gaiellaceae bacterium]|nr:hypothetical protein [Gaiellaceae bacterium]
SLVARASALGLLEPIPDISSSLRDEKAGSRSR